MAARMLRYLAMRSCPVSLGERDHKLPDRSMVASKTVGSYGTTQYRRPVSRTVKLPEKMGLKFCIISGVLVPNRSRQTDWFQAEP